VPQTGSTYFVSLMASNVSGSKPGAIDLLPLVHDCRHSIRPANAAGITLEIMLVVALIGMLAAIAVPSFIRARARSSGLVSTTFIR
jgi:hypothetical protein